MTASRVTKSTNVRLFQLLRLGIRLGCKLAPGPTSRYIAHLWFRLPAPAARRRRAPVPATSQPFELDCEGTTVRGYDWGNGPRIYLQHGRGGCLGDLETIAASLVANGFRVIAVDGPSHGNSGDGPYGPRAFSPLHLASALSAAIDKFGEPHAVVAHSLGCLAAVITLRERVEPQRVVLVSPFIGGPRFTRLFAKRLGVGPRTYTRFTDIIQRRVGKPLSYFDVPEPAMSAETLIVHDRNDRSTPIEHGRIIADAWPNARLHATQGLGHMRILHNPSVVGEVVDFLVRR